MLNGINKDIIAGFSVFLLALPLCLGISIASNFPPAAGILSAIVGGIIASWFGGARLSIKGPGAGLIVIALGSVQQLGYERTLAVGVVAALIQIMIGQLRKAVVAEIMPPSVIHGMLAAIGIIIISKQAYVMAGITPTAHAPLDLILQFPAQLIHLNPTIFVFGLISLTIAVIFSLFKKFAFIPSSLVILMIVIPLSLVYSPAPQFLINLPHNFFNAITFPDFSVVLSPISLKYIVMFALVGSIESSLTVCAVDSLAPQAAPSDLNNDLRAVGIGNLISALIGGFPMISEIVRSKANIDYGATSARANFFHGVFMLLAVLLLPSLMNLIPLSALAALLVFVGFKLASPKEFIHFYKIGRDQFFLFLVTCVVTLATDLLTGVGIGIILKLALHVIRGNSLNKLFKPKISIAKINHSIHIHIEGPFTFISYLKLKRMLAKAKNETNEIVINLSKVTYLDHTVLKKFQTLPNEIKDIKIAFEENHSLLHFYNHPLAARRIL